MPTRAPWTIRSARCKIHFYDAADGKLVWRGSTERILPRNAGTPAERERMLRETVAQLLAHYPPR
ncbi:hypothetical protein SSTU70S_03198 [Stutzerimonas stutzeri]